eukprot:3139728-Heterocapsa_arctica.AAC.1
MERLGARGARTHQAHPWPQDAQVGQTRIFIRRISLRFHVAAPPANPTRELNGCTSPNDRE